MPLGLCLLPAFVLLGIVPVVAGLLDRASAVTSAGARAATARPSTAGADPARLSTGRGPDSAALTGGPGPQSSSPGRAAATSHEGVPCTATIRPDARDERGITTAEYAVGTAAGAGLAGLLYKMLTGGFGDQLLKLLFDHVLGLLGIG